MKQKIVVEVVVTQKC